MACVFVFIHAELIVLFCSVIVLCLRCSTSFTKICNSFLRLQANFRF